VMLYTRVTIYWWRGKGHFSTYQP